MDLGLEGKVAWVLGGSSGLGRAGAQSLAGEKAVVAVSSRDAHALQTTATDIERATGSRCISVPCDVTDAAAISEAHRAVVSELGDVDILVANAGGPPPGGFSGFDDDALHSAFNLTTASAWRLAQAVIPAMKAKGSGVLIFLTSSTTKEVVPNLLLSNMMRAAVVGLAKTLSKELGADAIRVLCIAPGRIATARLEQLDSVSAEKAGRSVEEQSALVQATIPLGRYGDPKEFGDVLAFMASERASYVSGTTIMVDGGLLDGLLS